MKCISMFLLMGLILVSDASAHSLYVEFPRDLSTDANAEFWIAYGHGGSADQELDALPVARIVSPSGQPEELSMPAAMTFSRPILSGACRNCGDLPITVIQVTPHSIRTVT